MLIYINIDLKEVNLEHRCKFKYVVTLVGMNLCLYYMNMNGCNNKYIYIKFYEFCRLKAYRLTEAKLSANRTIENSPHCYTLMNISTFLTSL